MIPKKRNKGKKNYDRILRIKKFHPIFELMSPFGNFLPKTSLTFFVEKIKCFNKTCGLRMGTTTPKIVV
jgi:hypothetical protein